MKNNEHYMDKALQLALQAAREGEVPVGAIIVKNNQIIGSGYNQKEKHQLVTKHAELIAINQSAAILNNWRLTNCILYTTLEPCLMCAGAIYQSRITKVVYGASDPKGGALGSLYHVHRHNRLNHTFEVVCGVLESECSAVLKCFFKQKRQIKQPKDRLKPL